MPTSNSRDQAVSAESRHAAGISIIVPVLNEAELIDELIGRLKHLRELDAEIIIVDGQSTDATTEHLESAGFTVLRCPQRGRGYQLALGSTLATHDNLLFLHADTVLPSSALSLIEQALATGSACWGRFDEAQGIAR